MTRAANASHSIDVPFDNRKLVLPAKIGEVTQGTLFNGALAFNYDKCYVAGVVITARCDLAHGKTNVYHYLPVVRFEDWLERDFVKVVIDRGRKAVRQEIEKSLESKNLQPSVLIANSPRVLLDKFYLVTNPGRGNNSNRGNEAKSREKFQALVHKYELLEDAASRSIVPRDVVKNINLAFEKLCQSIIDECVHHRLAGYYYLPSIDSEVTGSGYVVLLREVRQLPVSLVSFLVKGLDADSYKSLVAADQRLAGWLSFDAAEFLMPLGKLRSPEIEHVVQTFSLLFSRVGVEDPPDHCASKLWSSYIGAERTESP